MVKMVLVPINVLKKLMVIGDKNLRIKFLINGRNSWAIIDDITWYFNVDQLGVVELKTIRKTALPES